MKWQYILLWVVLLSCSQDTPSKQINSSHPNGISELAALMRNMESHADQVRLALRQDRELPSLPERVETLTTATPTEDMHIDPMSFPVFASDYQSKLEELYQVEPGRREHAFNNLVRSCANCHHSHCPGPLMKIEKLYVKEQGG